MSADSNNTSHSEDEERRKLIEDILTKELTTNKEELERDRLELRKSTNSLVQVSHPLLTSLRLYDHYILHA